MRKCLLAALLILAFAAPAWAQTAANCPTYNTTSLSVDNMRVISACSFSTGPYDIIVITLTGEITCGPLSDAGTSVEVSTINPSEGANFSISGISGGSMTVTAMITPGSFTINTGDFLTDASSGSGIPLGINVPVGAGSGTTLKVTGQTSGTPGGVGVYTVSDNSVTVGAETVWSLPKFCCGPNGKPTSTNQLRVLLEHSACQNGKTYIVSYTGIQAKQFAANTTLWVFPTISGEDLGHGTQSASFNNGQLTIFSPATFTPPTSAGWLEK